MDPKVNNINELLKKLSLGQDFTQNEIDEINRYKNTLNAQQLINLYNNRVITISENTSLYEYVVLSRSLSSDVLSDELSKKIYAAISLVVVAKEGMVLQFIPERLRTTEVCEAAVNRNPWALKYVPNGELNEALILAAVKQEGMVLQFIPERLRTTEVCEAAVNRNPWALKYVPESKLDEALILAAVQKEGMMVQHIRQNQRTVKVYLAALTHTPEVVQFIPDQTMRNIFEDAECSKELHLKIVRQKPLALQQVSENQLDETLMLAAVAQEGMVLLCIPKHLRNEKVCEVAVKQNQWALKYVPENILSETSLVAAVRKDGMIIQHIHPDQRTKEVCEAAVSQNSLASKFCPDKTTYCNMYMSNMYTYTMFMNNSNIALSTPNLSPLRTRELQRAGLMNQ